jgi:hypothetical protein
MPANRQGRFSTACGDVFYESREAKGFLTRFIDHRHFSDYGL